MARRSNAEKEAEAEAIKNWNPRYKHNVIIYLWIYGILGAVTGITNDAALSYYKIVSNDRYSSQVGLSQDFVDFAANDWDFYGFNLYHD